MSEAGFFAQKRGSPTGFALVVLAHAGVLGALALIKGPQIIDEITRTRIYRVKVDPVPPPNPPPPNDDPRPRTRESYTVPDIPIVRANDGPVAPPLPPLPPIPGPSGTGITRNPPADPPIAPPVRRDAEYDSRYADALQPPYPASEERAQRDGLVRIRVTIGTNGRVVAVARLMASNESFWRSTERQALSRWRFRPATVDGRAIESTKILNVRFRIADL